jgi:hypothetical protein
MSDKEDRLRKMTQKSLRLFDKLKKVQEEEGDEISERHIELLEEMFTIIAQLVECPAHGLLEGTGVEVNVTRQNGKYSFTVSGLCCEEVRDAVDRKIVEFLDEV